MKRHFPFEALRDTPVKARVAVLSNCCAWGTALGCNSPPAPETGTGVVGLKSGIPETDGASVATIADGVDAAADVVETDSVTAAMMFDVVTIGAVLVVTLVADSVIVTVTVCPSQGGIVADVILLSKLDAAPAVIEITAAGGLEDVRELSNVKD